MAKSFNTKHSLLIGAPLVVGLLTSPLWATIPEHEEIGRSFVDTGTIDLVYPRLAQVGGDEIGGGNNGGGRDETDAPDDDGPSARINPGTAVVVSDAQTAQIVNQLNQIQAICEFMADEYRVACFATTYRELAKDIPANGDYAEVKKALNDAAQKLDTLSRNNRDRAKPALRARLSTGTGRTVSTPPIAAVRADRAPQINRQASDIVAEAETVLLRSASSDARRAIHYQRIAAAVGSNKVLLRSA